MRLHRDDIRELAAALADELEARGIVAPRMRAPGQGDPACNDEKELRFMDPTRTGESGASSYEEQVAAELDLLLREKMPSDGVTKRSSKSRASR